MSGNTTLRESLGWAGTIAAGAWLSMKVAHWLVDAMGSQAWRNGQSGPIKEIVEDVLDEHRADDTLMVHAFETALSSNGT